ncbi:hypothetical protein [Loktanella salsilacus]|uniref:hypothetical protein n=1 Tax=Loktanella salsilacus TaxID=195913 RepID=UPI0037350008
MIEVAIYEPELLSVEMLRVALSEETLKERLRAIENVKYDVRASAVESLFSGDRHINLNDPRYSASLLHVAKTSSRSHDAGFEAAQTIQRYEKKNERKLNVAEQVGKLVVLSILDNKFAGLHTETGILQQVEIDARQHNISGAKDKDVLRKIWSTYRGVVHLGMALDFCEDNPQDGINVFSIAEEFRRALSENGPKGTTKPYVNPDDQIKFSYISIT